GVRVLVVEDKADARELLRAALGQCGAQVTAVGTAAEALAALTEARPAVLVSDIGMPGEDGYALIQKVRARPVDQGGQIPALALTAYTRAEDRARAQHAGFNAHVAKPVDPTELVAAVADLARRAAAG